jgi:predicted dehydrogenase
MVHLTRRQFLRQAALAGSLLGAGSLLPGRASGGARASRDLLYLGFIGVGGQGYENLNAMAKEHVVALCDVDRKHLDRAAARFPKARKYADFRRLFEREKGLDGVVISTPDHTHAPATLKALKRGLHVYCEKPLCHSVHEARAVTEAALRQKVVTQMGTNGQSQEHFLRTVELIWAGVIGDVTEVHIWTNRPMWPQGQERPAGEDLAPAHLDWDLWLGPAPVRPYKATYTEGRYQGQAVYHPFVWRGWWDFGTGALGDIAPHAMNVAFWALKLGTPTSIEPESSGMTRESFPEWSILRFRFPARGKMPPVLLTWYDGRKLPSADLVEGQRLPDNGAVFVGRKGRLVHREPRPVLLPAGAFADYTWPPPTLPRRPEVRQDWLQAIKTGAHGACLFGYYCPMPEA